MSDSKQALKLSQLEFSTMATEGTRLVAFDFNVTGSFLRTVFFFFFVFLGTLMSNYTGC